MRASWAVVVPSHRIRSRCASNAARGRSTGPLSPWMMPPRMSLTAHRPSTPPWRRPPSTPCGYAATPPRRGACSTGTSTRSGPFPGGACPIGGRASPARPRSGPCRRRPGRTARPPCLRSLRFLSPLDAVLDQVGGDLVERPRCGGGTPVRPEVPPHVLDALTTGDEVAPDGHVHTPHRDGPRPAEVAAHVGPQAHIPRGWP